jgi:hypothetical protein
MEEQGTPEQFSQPAPQASFQVPNIPFEAFELMKARAREEAMRITLEQQAGTLRPGPKPSQVPTPNVIYVRRNLTVAELLLTLLLACGLVTGIPVAWKTVSNFLPHIEINVK